MKATSLDNINAATRTMYSGLRVETWGGGRRLRVEHFWLFAIVLLGAFRSFDNTLLAGYLSWSKILTAAILPLVLTRYRQIGGPARRHFFFLFAPVFGLVLWGGASILWSANIRGAVENVVSWVSLLGLDFVLFVLFHRDRGGVRMALIAQVVAMTIFAVLGFWELSHGPIGFRSSVSGWAVYQTATGERVGRFFGFFADANATALLSAFAIFGLIGLVEMSSKRRLRAHVKVIGVLAAGILVLALFKTLSRTGLIAFIFGMAILVKKRGSKAFRIWVILFVLYGSWLFAPAFQTRFERATKDDYGSRMTEIRGGLKLWAETPINGIGLMSYRIRVRDLGLYGPWGIPVIHNNYLKILVELGLVGAGLLVSFVIRLYLAYRRTVLRAAAAGDGELQWLTAVVGASLAASSVFSLALGVDSFNQVWLLFGLLAVLCTCPVESRRRSWGRFRLGNRDG